MATINVTTSKRGRGGKPRLQKRETRVDMTPMVDLGFLLITFFILTTTLIQLNTLQMAVPSNDKGPGTPIGGSKAVTILIDKDNKLYYYFGMFNEKQKPELVKTTYTAEGIRRMLLLRNLDVNNQIRALNAQLATGKINETEYRKLVTDAKKMKTAPHIIIKATDESSYNNLIQIIDEMNICNIGIYSLVDITKEDEGLIKNYKNS
jgi:biopolymer transport protein ExbD